MKHEDPHWRRAKLAVLILERAARGTLSTRDCRLAALFAADEGVSNRLIYQAQQSRRAFTR